MIRGRAGSSAKCSSHLPRVVAQNRNNLVAVPAIGGPIFTCATVEGLGKIGSLFPGDCATIRPLAVDAQCCGLPPPVPPPPVPSPTSVKGKMMMMMGMKGM
jgi:hypothetical protein